MDEIRELIDSIETEEVMSWDQLTIKGILLGVDVNSSKFLSSYLDIFLIHKFHYDTLIKFYRIFLEKIKTDDELDKCFSNLIIERILKLDGEKTYFSFERLIRFEGRKILLKIDERNPKILLKYFLIEESHKNFGEKTDIYLNLLEKIIQRCIIRSVKNKKFREYKNHLQQKYDEILRMQTFLK